MLRFSGRSLGHDSLLLIYTHMLGVYDRCMCTIRPEFDYLPNHRTMSTRDVYVYVCTCAACIVHDDNYSDKFRRHTQNSTFCDTIACSTSTRDVCSRALARPWRPGNHRGPAPGGRRRERLLTGPAAASRALSSPTKWETPQRRCVQTPTARQDLRAALGSHKRDF